MGSIGLGGNGARGTVCPPTAQAKATTHPTKVQPRKTLMTTSGAGFFIRRAAATMDGTKYRSKPSRPPIAPHAESTANTIQLPRDLV